MVQLKGIYFLLVIYIMYETIPMAQGAIPIQGHFTPERIAKIAEENQKHIREVDYDFHEKMTSQPTRWATGDLSDPSGFVTNTSYVHNSYRNQENTGDGEHFDRSRSHDSY